MGFFVIYFLESISGSVFPFPWKAAYRGRFSLFPGKQHVYAACGFDLDLDLDLDTGHGRDRLRRMCESS